MAGRRGRQRDIGSEDKWDDPADDPIRGDVEVAPASVAASPLKDPVNDAAPVVSAPIATEELPIEGSAKDGAFDTEAPHDAPDKERDSAREALAEQLNIESTPQRAMDQAVDDPEPPSPAAADSPDGIHNILRSLSQTTPFFDLYCYVARHSVPHGSREERIAAYRSQTAFFYGVSIFLDAVFRLVVIALLLSFIIVVGLKTFDPIPWPNLTP